MRARRRLIGFAAAFAGLAAATVYAQRIWVGGPTGGYWRGGPPAFASRADFDGSFNYCRGYYSSVTRERSGSGWGTDYPGADNNFSVRLAEHGIPVYEVRPGIIETDMTAGAKETYDRRIADGLIPERRWGQPDDVGRVVAALLRGDAPYATGSVINVDGGLSLPRL